MAFSRNPYDDSVYEQSLKISTFEGRYRLNEPRFFQEKPYLDSVYIRTSTKPFANRNLVDRIDAESEIKGVGRPSAREVVNQHIPNRNTYNIEKQTTKEFNVVETRLDNPGCTLRGTGFNRWDWVPINPQKNVMIPFDYMVDTKLVAKDNHRQCIVKPEMREEIAKRDSANKSSMNVFYGRGNVRN